MELSFKKMLLLGMSATVLAACNTQTTSPNDVSNEAETSETADSSTGEESSSAESTVVQLENVDMEDETAWQEEPAYGEPVQVISTSGCTAPINVALDMGFYEEEGLDVELVQSETYTTDTVGTGQAAIGAGHITSSLIPIINGLNMQYLGPMHTGCKALYVAADSEVESAGDMDGMNIGIHGGLGESDHNIALRFLQEEGADPTSANFTTTDTAASVEAIRSGELDGAIYTENYAVPFVEDGTLKKVNSLTTDEAFQDEVCCAYYVNKDFARENPITTKKLARAMYRANAWAEADTESYVDQLYSTDLLSGDEQVGYDFIDSLNYHPTMDMMSATVEEITSDYIDLGLVDSDVDPATILDSIYAPIGFDMGDFSDEFTQ